MTDQPKPNQPAATPNTAETKQTPHQAPPTNDKASASQAKGGDSDAKSDKPSETTRQVEPPKPTGDAKPIEADAKRPTAPTSSSSSSAPLNSPSAPTVPSKPASMSGSEPKPASASTEQTAPKPPAAPAQPTAPTEQTAPKPASASTEQTAPKPPAAPTQPTAPKPAESSAAPASPSPASPAQKPAEPPAASNTTVPMPPKADAPASNVPPAANKEDTIPPSSNGTKVTQRFTDPSPAAQTSPGTICPNCGHRNRPGTLICDNCGTSLISGTKSAVGTRDLVSATEAAAASSEPLMDAAQLNAVESAGGSLFTDDMVLRIEIEGGATPMLVYPKQEIILGRRDPNTGTLPDVDMTAYSGYRMGVSRTHASIRLQDKQLNLSDRGSSNGTFLNGTRLVAHRPYPIKDGDEIRLGQMVLKIYFQSNKNRK